MVPGLLAEIERVVKVLISKIQRPTKSTSYRIQRKMRSTTGQKLRFDIFSLCQS